jgi:hypothetical protein
MKKTNNNFTLAKVIENMPGDLSTKQVISVEDHNNFLNNSQGQPYAIVSTDYYLELEDDITIIIHRLRGEIIK